MTNKRSKAHTGWPLQVLLTILAVFLTFCSVLVIGIEFYRSASRSLSIYSRQLDDKRFSQINKQINDKLSKLEMAAMMVSNDTAFQEAVRSYHSGSDYVRSAYLQSYLQELNSRVILMIPDILGISVLSDYQAASTAYAFSPHSTQSVFLPYFGCPLGSEYIFFPGDALYPVNGAEGKWKNFEKNVLFFYPIFDRSDFVGTVCIALSPSYFLDDLSDFDHLAVVCRGSNILYNSTSLSDSKLVHFVSEADAPEQFQIAYSYGDDLALIYEYQTLTLKNNLHHLQAALLFVGLFLVIAAFLAAKFFVRPIVHPLSEMTQRLAEIQQQNSDCSLSERITATSNSNIFVYLSVTVLSVSIMFSIFSFGYIRSSTHKVMLDSLDTSMQQAVSETDAAFLNYQYVSLYLAYNNHLQSLVLDASNDTYEDSMSLEGYLKRWMKLFASPVDIQVYDKDRNPIYATNYLPADIKPLMSSPSRKIEYTTLSAWNGISVLISRQLINLQNLDPVGYFAVQTDEMYISRFFDFFPSSEYSVFLHTPDGVVISSSDKSAIGLKLPLVGRHVQTITKPLPNADLSLTLCYDYSALDSELKVTQKNLAYFILLLLFLILLVNMLLTHFFASQFHLLSGMMSNYHIRNHDNIPRRMSIVWEINQFYNEFHKMSQRVQMLLNEVIETENRRAAIEIEKHQSDLLLLQSQIKPHFLYNTFELINSLISIGKADSAAETIRALASMLRFSTQTKTLLIPMKEELHYVQMYLDIMCTRTPGNLNYTFDVSPEAMECKTVKFILQPIVENSIHHGLRPKGGMGTIRITGCISDNRLILMVRDDGIGIDAQRLQELRASITGHRMQSSIGLPNIANRLNLIYGERASLTIASKEGQGCIITIIQPCSGTIPPLASPPQSDTFN